MPLIMVYDQEKEEIRLIRSCLGSLDSKSEVTFLSAYSFSELVAQISKLVEVHVFCSDFSLDGEDPIRYLRETSPEAQVVVIADSSTSPSQYIKPGILPSGLLLRPFSERQVKEVLDAVLAETYKQMREQQFRNEVFTAPTREGTIRVPYSRILYFEARNKKIVLSTGRTEMDFYSTLEGIAERVPEYFLRCHKGYLINTLLVNRVDLSQNILGMYGGYEVPVSRSFRAVVKEKLA